MGVFSIIQKHKLHHSNIYRGCAYPFMQRITWSGVAHAGVFRYPARMAASACRMAFLPQRLWNGPLWRAVDRHPREMTRPVFSHPLLSRKDRGRRTDRRR